MEILICVKQVPGSSKVEIDPANGTLKRSGADAKLNPYDLFALETGIRLKERYGGTITAITMGPPQAEAALYECCYLGCDKAILITDRAFGGADVLATSFTLSEGIKATGPFDIILTGKQTTDGDTAQVGPELSEWLGIPQIGNLQEIKEIRDGHITGTSVIDNAIYTCTVPLPALISVDSEICTPRLPSYRRKKETEFQIKRITLSEMEDKDTNHYGLSGSPTQVQRIFPPETKTERIMFHADGMEGANKISEILLERKFI